MCKLDSGAASSQSAALSISISTLRLGRENEDDKMLIGARRFGSFAKLKILSVKEKHQTCFIPVSVLFRMKYHLKILFLGLKMCLVLLVTAVSSCFVPFAYYYVHLKWVVPVF